MIKSPSSLPTHTHMHITEGDLSRSKHYYDGEAFLCPPIQKPPGMQTTLGVVQISLDVDGTGAGVVKSLAVEQPSDIVKYFGSAKVDSLCRQMGFSRADHDAIYTQEALRHSLGFNCIK